MRLKRPRQSRGAAVTDDKTSSARDFSGRIYPFVISLLVGLCVTEASLRPSRLTENKVGGGGAAAAR